MGLNVHTAFVPRFLAVAALCGFSGTGFAGIELPNDPRGSTVWAAEHLRSALGPRFSDAHIVVERMSGPQARESFSIEAEGSELRIRAADGNGEMYGLLELAEEVSNSNETTWSSFAGAFKPVNQQPASGFRADNSFLHVERKGIGYLAQKLHLIGPQRLLEDREMWRQYIDMLAENRFNTLDLHGVYNVANTSFQNILPQFVSVPEYPRVGNLKTQHQNLRDLRGLLSYANKRGITVGLMNYSAKVDGLTNEQLKDYTAKAVAALLREAPKLKLFGFRVGESGEAAGFLGSAYMNGLHASGRSDVRIYTRSWKTTPEELNALGAALPGRVDVEVKYNGEHLGLPYQAIQGPANSHYSYNGFMAPESQYSAIWQIRANGTHRFWTWAGTDFIRRTIKTIPFGGARGFSLEPETAYYPFDTSRYYRSADAKNACKYIWQKNWPWYLAWGRLGYNPDLPEETLVSAYRKRLGGAAEEIYAAVQASSAIVPMALAYRFTGPDQRNMSPETQTGAFDTQKRGMKPGPLSFAENAPMDPRSYAGIDEFVKEKIAGTVDGRVSPVRVAGLFASASAETMRRLDKLHGGSGSQVHSGGSPASEQPSTLLETDLLCAAHLGSYYSERILGTMHLDYALKTGSDSDFKLALDHLASSRSAWRRLSAVADGAFLPIQDPLIGERDFAWSSQIELLNRLDAGIPALWAAAEHRKDARPLRTTTAEQGDLTGFTVRSLGHKLGESRIAEISCTVASPENIRKVTCWAKDFPSEAEWKPHPMSQTEAGLWSCGVPIEPGGLLYLVELEDGTGQATQFPPPLVETPYKTISAPDMPSGSH